MVMSLWPRILANPVRRLAPGLALQFLLVNITFITTFSYGVTIYLQLNKYLNKISNIKLLELVSCA